MPGYVAAYISDLARHLSLEEQHYREHPDPYEYNYEDNDEGDFDDPCPPVPGRHYVFSPDGAFWDDYCPPGHTGPTKLVCESCWQDEPETAIFPTMDDAASAAAYAVRCDYGGYSHAWIEVPQPGEQITHKSMESWAFEDDD